MPTNGYIKITLLMRVVPLTKHSVIPMVLVVQLRSNARIVFQIKDVGLKTELKFMELTNMVMLLENKTSLMKFIKEVQLLALLLSQKNFSITLEVFSQTKLEEKTLITILVLLVGEKKMVLNIGLLETLGEVIGEKEEMSD